jgi:hypothetical protein
MHLTEIHLQNVHLQNQIYNSKFPAPDYESQFPYWAQKTEMEALSGCGYEAY